MSERPASISRIPVHAQAGIERVAIHSQPARVEQRPVATALLSIWRGRWIVIACVALSLVYGYIRVLTTVPVYTASSTVCVEQSQSIMPDAMNTGQSPNYLLTQCQIIHSTALMTRALAEPFVADAECLKAMPPESAVAYLKNAVIVGPDKQGGDLIDVEMQSLNPQDAAKIVNGVVSAYISYQADQHRATAVEVMNRLQKEIIQQRAELLDAQQKLTKFKKDNPDLVLRLEEGKGAGSPLTEKLSEAKTTRLELQIASDRAAQLKEDPEKLKQVVDGLSALVKIPSENAPVVDPALEEQYRDAYRALILKGPGQKDNPEVQQLQSQLLQYEAEISLQKHKAAQKYLAFLAEQLDAAKDRQAALQQSVNDEQNDLNNIYARKAEYEQLVQETVNTQSELDVLNTRIKSVNVNGNLDVLPPTVLEPARPNQTTGVGKTQKLGMALVAGLMVGLGGALLIEMLEQRLRTVEEVERLLACPILGPVPHITPPSSRYLTTVKTPTGTPWANYFRAAGGKKRLRWNSVQSLMQRGQAMHLQPRSDIAEAYRSIRTGIYFGLAGQPAKTILVTSPSAGDGKTTLASNLAIAIAQAGRSVLLIDADCWHPTQKEIFGLGDSLGLTSVLRKKAKLSEVVKKTDITNLDVLPCGELPTNPAELLDSPALLQLLSEASERYDQVLIDSPPVVPITDARILAARCGATILVLRAGKSTRRMADDAFEALTAVGAPILGVVVNDVPRKGHARAYQTYGYAARQTVEDWNRYASEDETIVAEPESAVSTNGFHGQNGNGHIVHLPGVNLDDDAVLGRNVD